MSTSERIEKKPRLTTVGWREWVAFPDWKINHLKAKVDTGARTSSLHCYNLQWFERYGERWVRFEVHPWQRSADDAVQVEAQVVATRDVKSSSGAVDHRPVIHTRLLVVDKIVDAEITLTNRDEMGFRMLLGRQAIRGHFRVNPGISYRGGRPNRIVRRKNRGLS